MTSTHTNDRLSSSEHAASREHTASEEHTASGEYTTSKERSESRDRTASSERNAASERRSSTVPSYPDAAPVGSHLVIDKSEWIPGADPERLDRFDGQGAYRERYYRCIKCGEERQAKRDFPEHCEGDPTSSG